MESLSRPLHRRKHSAVSSSSFSRRNPYAHVVLSGGDKAKFQPLEYAEIFSGSSSIPVLDLSGFSQPGGCRSSELDYSNIFGAKAGDVALSHEQLFNKKTKTRIAADSESPFQEYGSLNPGNGLQQQFNLSFNKTSQRSSNESNGKTHIAQLQAVPGFTHFVDDGTPQPQKKEGDDTPVPLVKREVSRTWSFSTGSDATKVKRGLSSEKSHTPDKSCLPIFASKDASVEIGGENPPPLSDEELDENSDAAKSIAALKKAIEQAQESMRLAKMIMQKKREGTKDGSRAWRSKGRSKVEVLEDEKETRTEHASGGSKENNLKGKNQRLDPTVHVPGKVGGRSNPALSHSDSLLNARKANVESVVEIFKPTKTEHASGGSKENNLEGKNQRLGPTYHVLAEVDGKSDPILSHSDNLLNARKANVESVMEIFEPANDHGDVFVEVDKNSTPSCSQSGSTNTDKKDEMKNIRQNVGISELHGETTDFTGLAETSVLESGKVDCNASSPMHQAERPGDISRRIESAENTSKSQQELEQSSNEEAADQCQATASTVKGPAKLLEQLERVLSVSGSTQEQEKIMHGNGHLRISQENEPPEDTGCIADKEMYEKKFVEHEELYLAEHSTMRRSNFNTLHNDLLTQAEENMIDQAHIDEQPENVAEWKEDDQDAQFSDEGENAMVLNEEIIWYDSELQLEESVEENVNEREPGIVPVVEEAVTKVDMVFKSEIDEKLKFELDEVSQTVPGIIGENEIAMRCMDASEFEQIETIQIGTNGGDKEVQNGRTPLDVEELNHTDGAADTRKNLPDIGRKLNDSASQKDNSEAFAVHSNDHGTIFSDSHGVNTSTFFSRTPEPCSADNEAEQYRAVLRGREENYSLPLETEEENEADKQFEVEVNIMPGTDSLCGCSSAEKLTESQVDNTYDGFSSDSKSTSFVLTNVDQEKTLPNNEDMFKTATEIHNAANTNMQNFSEQHVSTDNQLERIDTTNVMPDMQQNSENSEESQSTSDMFKTATEIHNAANTNMQNFSEQHVSTDNQLERIDTTNVMPDMQQNSENSEESQSTSDVESVDEVSADESPACRDNAKDISSYMEEEKVDLDMKSDERVNAAKQSGCLNSKDQTHLSQTNSEPKEMDKSSEAEREIKTGQHMEENIQNRGRTSLSENKDAKGNEQDEMDSWQRIEAIRRGREREKGRMAAEREREKDRIAVERAIREARERAFAEARERAERAAAAEAHRRVNGEVREKTVKASVGTRPSVDKASTEAKIRVERAAVERATAEARERALEKAMSQKNSMGSRGQATKYNAERSSSSSSNNGLKHSFSFYDLEKSDGTTSESAKRCKASLERHQRIMERAAKALAEKNTYDLLAQKEQDERSRLAKSLDADIKRWATGKEGNLRALLSTLQYILGPDSAWHPVSLTDIVTAAAVKKTYRKATLCVHPDKLQQRGASIQQKYICEKIFDLLKVAWNKFNSEEN